MDRKEKRLLYSCGDSYSTLEGDAVLWPALFKTKVKIRAKKPAFELNKDLNSKIYLYEGDITKLEVDAIVNAANRSLLGGGGVDGAIHRAAGKHLLDECRTLDGCHTGQSKITAGYHLPAYYVIHTVGPMGKHPDELASCYRTALDLSKENHISSIAFPCVSTGIYGYPNEDACHVVLRTVREWLETGANAKLIKAVVFVLFLQVDQDVYEQLLPLYFPVE